MQAVILFGYAFISNVALAVLPHEPAVIWYGPRLGVWPTTVVATAGTVAAALVDHRLFVPLIRRVTQGRRTASASFQGANYVSGLFRRFPFAVIALSGLTPLPFFPVKALAFTTDYPLGRYIAAVAARSVTRYALLACVGAAYALSRLSTAWLWVASACLALQWLGDSLDGTLARVRGAERPRYGYYLDHVVDAFSTAVIGLGLGLSPYVHLNVALGVVIVYLALSINVYLEANVFGLFRLAYSRLGPTEVRIILIAANAALAPAVWGRLVTTVAPGTVGLLGICLLGMLLARVASRSEEHTSELQSRLHLVCRLLLEKKKQSRLTIDSR